VSQVLNPILTRIDNLFFSTVYRYSKTVVKDGICYSRRSKIGILENYHGSPSMLFYKIKHWFIK
jgi:hypothetical protein